jgi:dipeptidyl aminopeptidase/acylaminoacyl peptidase
MPVKNVTADYPPTFLMHGTIDTDVPHEQSAHMAEQLKQHGVRHEFISIPGAEHGFAGGDPKLVEAAYTKAFAFVDQTLRRE